MENTLLVTDIGFPNGDGGNPVDLLLLTQPPKNSTLFIKYKSRQHTESDSHYNSLVYTTSNILTGLQTLKPQLCEAVPVIFFSPVVWG